MTVNLYAIDEAGNIFVADWFNYKIRKISDGVVSTFAGSTQKYADGVGLSAGFESVTFLKFHNKDTTTLLVREDTRIRMIKPDGTVSALAGSTKGTLDGEGKDALFNDIGSFSFEKDGSILLSDFGANSIRKIKF